VFLEILKVKQVRQEENFQINLFLSYFKKGNHSKKKKKADKTNSREELH